MNTKNFHAHILLLDFLYENEIWSHSEKKISLFYELEKKAAGEWLFVLIKHQNLLTFFVPYMLLSIVFNVLLAVVGTLGLKICSYK